MLFLIEITGPEQRAVGWLYPVPELYQLLAESLILPSEVWLEQEPLHPALVAWCYPASPSGQGSSCPSYL